MFAFLTDAKEAFTALVTGLLMVAGGFLVGYFLGAVVAWAVGRYVFKQKDTEIFKRVGRPVGGVVLALIVALIVFTGKGKPHGEGGDGKGTPDADPNAGKNTPTKIDTPKLPDPNLKTPPDVKPSDVILQVTVYGGAGAQGDRCYQLDDAQTLVNFPTLTKAATDRRASEKGKVSLAIRYPEDKNKAPGNPGNGQLHQDVARLVQWATAEAKFDVTFPASR